MNTLSYTIIYIYIYVHILPILRPLLDSIFQRNGHWAASFPPTLRTAGVCQVAGGQARRLGGDDAERPVD